jgi:4a-hydroxytetrahydrobiopterin dehydratase
MDLTTRHCTPCTGGDSRLSPEQTSELLPHVSSWTLRDERLARAFAFRDFAEAMKFVNAMAAVAEAEGHHPDFCIHWNRVEVTIWTHAVGGLTENDFVLAAKVDELLKR